jgi:hypothetical protein
MTKGKKLLLSTIGAGAAYLMRNKKARDKVISTVQTFLAKRKSPSRVQ